MTGVVNQEARQRVIKHRTEEGVIVVVRIKPGFNVIDDKAWSAIKGNETVKNLIKGGSLIAGADVTAEQAADKDLKAQTKEVTPKMVASLKQQVETGANENAKLTEELAAANARIAELEKAAGGGKK